MPHYITEDCINCGACEPECPTNSISQGEVIYVINEETCNDCIDQEGGSKCVAVCPVDCIFERGKEGH
ncbi:MAG: 4Fe-4S binding protein [bacterium]|nr:4Fe-4S binding protein [bacterium]